MINGGQNRTVQNYLKSTNKPSKWLVIKNAGVIMRLP